MTIRDELVDAACLALCGNADTTPEIREDMERVVDALWPLIRQREFASYENGQADVLRRVRASIEALREQDCAAPPPGAVVISERSLTRDFALREALAVVDAVREERDGAH